MNTAPLANPVRSRQFWLLLLICCLTLLPFLGLTEFNSKGEPREAVVSLSMLQQDNWLLPRNNGGEIPYKPPFFHWLVAGAGLLNGGVVNEYASRLPSALALIALTLSTFCFFARRRGAALGLLTAMVTFTAWELHRAGMNTRVDMVLTALTVGAVMLLFRYAEKGLRGVPWGAVLLMSAATLTKGPVGILVPCLVAGVYMLLRGVGFFWAFFMLVLWGVVSLVIPLVWYAAAWQQGGQEFLDLVMEENFGRMTNSMVYDSCVHPWPYNVGVLLGGWLPWTLAMAMALFAVPWRKMHAGPVGSIWRRFCSWLRSLRPETLLSLVAAVVIFVFYCIPQSKRSVYLMPVYPFMAFFISMALLWMAERGRGLLKAFGDVMAVLAALLFVVFLAVKCGLVPESVFGHGRHAAQNAAMLAALRDAGGFSTWFWAVVSPAAACCWWMAWRRGKARRIPLAISGVIVAVYISLAGAYQPPVMNARSVKDIARQLDLRFPASSGERIYEFISGGVFAKGDPIHYFEIDFYLGDRVGNFYKDRPASGLLLLSDEDAAAWFPAFEREGYRFEKVWQSPRPLLKQPTSLHRFRRN